MIKGNACVEGLGKEWDLFNSIGKKTLAKRNTIRNLVTLEGTKFQYFTGFSDPCLIAPGSYTLDQDFLDRPGADEIQFDFFKDY